jgi:hypothetical protein
MPLHDNSSGMDILDPNFLVVSAPSKQTPAFLALKTKTGFCDLKHKHRRLYVNL